VAALSLGCLLTASRSSIIGSALAAFTYILYGGAFSGRVSAVSRMLSLVFVLVALVLLFVLSDQIFEFLSRGEPTTYVVTFSDRTYVWQAATTLIDRSPIVGHGFIIGPKLIKTLFTISYWAPPHAHNDILNAAVAGGYAAGALLAIIYIWAAITSCRIKTAAPLLSVTFIPLFVSAMFEPSISHQITVGTILMVGFLKTVAVVGHDVLRKRTPTRVRIAHRSACMVAR
jgi:O-antigen ligase